MKDSLLKEAIADATQVRDAAYANARLSLEETFKPHLSSILSARLRNELGLNEEADASSEIGSNGVTVKEPAPKMPSKAASDSSHITNKGLETDTLGEGFDDLDGEDPHAAPSGPMAGAPAAPAAPAPMAAPAAGSLDVDISPDGMGGEEMDISGDMEGDLDLDAIIRELELDLSGQDGDMGMDASAHAPSADPTLDEPVAEAFSDAMAGSKVNGPMDGSLKEDAEGVHSDGKSPSAVDGVNGGKKVTPGQVVTGTAAETMTEGEELDLDEILREMEAEDGSQLSEKIANENAELKRSLREHREAVRILRDRLNEVNVLNSKLSFTNRLFKNFDLNVKQKMHVVETFDRARDVRDVKLIYTVMAESFAGKTGNPVKAKTARSITEGMASRSVTSTAPKSQQVLAEGDEMRARMQKLAGIK